MTTQEGNKLIAEFMGMKSLYPDVWVDAKTDDIRILGEYRPHADWNELMPVVQKILSTDTGTMDVYTLYVCDSLRTADIEKVRESCIDFITWYITLTPKPLPMPNKYYLREDRMAVKPEMNEPEWPGFYESDIQIIEYYNQRTLLWEQHIKSLPALDVDADYLKRLSPGWFEGEERYEVLNDVDKWVVVDESWYSFIKEHRRRLTIVAPQEAELPIPFYCANEFKPNGSSCDEQCDECKKDENLQAEKGQEGEVMITLSKAKEMAVDFMWENKSLFRPQDGYRTLLKVFNEWFKDNKYFQKTIPATPQPVTGEEISFAELKWNIGSLFNQNIKMSDNGKAIEGNPAVHAIAEYVHNLLAASRPSDAVELAGKT